jgi:hypothetical protein
MTHSLHRLGNISSLRSEFIVLTFGHSRRSKGVFESKKATFQKKNPGIYKIAKNGYKSLKIDRIIKKIKDVKNRDKNVGPYVIKTKGELYQCLKKIKRAKNGRSVVVSGIIDDIDDCLKKLDLRMHTVQYSLGYFGKTELLPDSNILEMTTMCGHHMISPELVKKLARDIKRGKLTSKEASSSMEKLCVCKIFNKDRATDVFERMKKSTNTESII